MNRPTNITPEDFFVPQFETAEAVEREIANRATTDLRLPAWNWCGMCCTRMILLALGRAAPTLNELYERATQCGVYREEAGRIVGAYHKELATYLRKEFGLNAATERNITLTRLMETLHEDTFVIASVSPEIRHLTGPPPTSKSGHLVLVYALNTPEEGKSQIILHNSTGFASLKTQCHVHAPASRFMDCFSGNAILVHP